jgi:hypothetical protein
VLNLLVIISIRFELLLKINQSISRRIIMKNLVHLKKIGEGYKFNFENGVYLGYAYPEIDGVYVFVFESITGCWNSYVLKMIAERLDELNKEWDDHLTQYFD